MSDRKPLMPKATASWLIENTTLTFEQIAHFCQMHFLEVKGIADGDVATGIKGMDPIASGQLTREEIKKGEDDAEYRLNLLVSKVSLPEVKTKRGPRYTPVSRRQDRPNAILWILRAHPELRDSQIMRLVGTTKPTIAQIKDRTHWNSTNLQPQDPVTLGLCSQTDLDNEVQKAAKRLAKERGEQPPVIDESGTLLPTAQTTIGLEHAKPAAEAEPAPEASAADVDARILEQLKGLTGTTPEEDGAAPADTPAESSEEQP